MKIGWLVDLFPLSWIRRSFRTKMVVSILCVVSLSLTIVLTSYYRQMSEVVERNTYKSLEELTEQSVSTIELYLEIIRNQAWDFFIDDAVQDFVGDMQESSYDTKLYYRDKLSLIVRRNPLIRSITLYNLDGMGVNNDTYINDSTREKDEIIQSALERDGVGGWEITPTGTGNGVKGTPVDYTLSFTQALKKITLYQQKEIGVLWIELNIERFQNMLNVLKMDYDGQFHIVNSQGVIIVAEDSGVLGQSLADDPWFQSYSNIKGPIGRSVVQLNGKRWISLYHKIDTTDWAVIGKIPLDQVLVSVNRVRDNTLTVGFISLVISLMIAYGVSLSVTRPLKTLRQNMQHIKMGILDTSIPVTSRDEIGYLQRTFNQMSKEIHRLITRVYKAELLKQEAEIKALQSQINPHFLYNALGAIDSFASIQGDKRISSISQALGMIFRYNISGGNTATVKEEIEQIRLYLSIQQIRYGERLHYEIDVDPELNGMFIPKLLLQPVVENAMVHGIEPKRGRSTIRICVRSLGEQGIQITVEDNGIGMTAERLSQVRENINPQRNRDNFVNTSEHHRSSIGMLNVSQRIALFYGSSYGMEVTSREDWGTVVRLVIEKSMDGGDHIVQSIDRR